MTNDTDIVMAIRNSIEAKIGAPCFQLWLGRPDSIRYQFGAELATREVVIAAADDFTLNRLRRNLSADITSAVREVAGDTVTIAFRIDEQLKRTNTTPISRKAKLAIDPTQKTFEFAESNDSPSVLDFVDPSEPVAPVEPEKPRGRKFAHLQNFIVGEENQLAFAAAKSVVTKPGDISPLYLYGPTGCGKTHLVEGIWSGVRKAAPNNRCVYLAAEQFTTLFVEAINGKGLPNFRRKIRDVDLLVIDDVQFLSGKRATLQELLATVDHFTREGKQLVLAADRPAAQVPGLDEVLVARVSGGLVLEIKSPEAATRRNMLQSFMVERGNRLSMEILDFLAQELPGDARQMMGALNRLEAIRQATGRAITITTVRDALRDVLRASRKMIRLADIEKIVCEVFHIAPGTLQTEAKARSVTQPRMLALWLARKYTRAGLSEIGQHFGLRSHSTVISAQKKVNGWLELGGSVRFPQGDCEAQEAIRRLETALRAV